MNLYISVGLFALYVGLVSLAGLMAEREAPTVTAAKRYWGRKRGLTLHFLANIAFPLVFGIVFLSRGVIGFGSGEPNWGLFTAASQERTAYADGDRGPGVTAPDQVARTAENTSRTALDLTTNPLLRGFP